MKLLQVSCVTLLFAAGALAGCSRETPHKPETGQAAAVAKGAAGRTDVLPSGEELFKQYCSSCHPNGGNVSNPERTLHGSRLKSNHITTPDDIVRIMRRPLSRMIRFDPAMLSDRDARIIAEYVLKTFK
jgi:cytochrome c6